MATRPLGALLAISQREIIKFSHQHVRVISALVRPALWLLVVAVGFQPTTDTAVHPFYNADTPYQVYIVPGLLGMVLLFNGIQSSLSSVYEREMGLMRLLLTAPQPRWFLLFSKLVAGTLLSLLQAYAFLLLCALWQVALPWSGWLYALPAMLISGLMLGALGLMLSVYIKQLENFVGTMNFVIFPVFFISSALYPLTRLQASGHDWLYYLAQLNPLTHAVELIRFALYGLVNLQSCIIVLSTALVFFLLAVRGYDPQHGMLRKKRREG